MLPAKRSRDNQKTHSKLEGRFYDEGTSIGKAAVWGAIGGAIAAIIIGFVWGGWVTSGTAGRMAETSAETAIVQAFTPLCVAKAEQEPEQLVLLKKEGSYQREDFVVKAGWVNNVNEKYRSAVAEACASTIVEAMEAKPAG